MKKNHLELNRTAAFIICAILTISTLFMACRPSGNNENKLSLSAPLSEMQEDTTRLIFYANEIDSIRILFADEEELTTYMNEKDFITLSLIAENAIYDTVWNDQDIMIKMVTPDYTLIISYQNKNQDNNDFMTIWKETGKIKYQNIWYILPEHSILQISTLLDSYHHI